MAQHPGQLWAFYAALSADNISQGFAGTVLVVFMSSADRRNFTATQYALLVSLANLPGKFVGGVSGYIVEATSYSTFFALSALTVIPTPGLGARPPWASYQGAFQTVAAPDHDRPAHP